MNPPADRQIYRPSGALDAIPFLVMLALAAGAALLAGYVVHLCTPLTFPGVAMGPLVASMPVAGVVAIAVRVGKCRNPLIAALLGFFAGMVVYVGAFQSALAAAKGNNQFFRVDLLPAWLDEHVNNNNLWNPGFAAANAAAPQQADPEDLFFRWAVLAGGLFAGCITPVTVGWIMGAKPFSEPHGRWLKAWPVRLSRRSGIALADALADGSADELAATIQPIPLGQKLDSAKGFAQLVVEYLPGEADAAVYVSVSVMATQSGKQAWPKSLVKRWQLTAEEAAAIAGAIAIPNAAFGKPREGTLPGDRVSTAIGAKIIALPDQDAGHVLSSRNLWIATAVGFLPLIVGLGASAAAGTFAWQKADDLDSVELAVLIAVAVVSAIGALAWIVLYGDYLPAKFLHGQARRQIAGRPDPFVFPDEEGAFFIQMIPRKNWGRVMLENAEELGFMRLDETRGFILFEGDRERWMIPRESVVSYDLEAFDIGPTDPNAGPAFWLVVLKVNVDGRVWEAPLAMRPISLSRGTPTTRRLDNERLRNRIRRVVGHDDEDDD